MESHPYTKTRGVGPVTTQLTPGAEPASSKSAGAPGPWSCSPTCRAWSESSRPSFTDSTSTGAGCTCSPRNTGAGSTWSPCDTGAGSTWSPCNKMLGHSAFLHKQLDVTHFTIRAVLSYALGYTCASCLTTRPKKSRPRFRQGPCQLPPPPAVLPLRVSNLPGRNVGKILLKVGTRSGTSRGRPASFTAILTSGTAGYPDALRGARFWRHSAGTQ